MTDINAIMQQDPLKLSEQDIDAIVDTMRAARKQFNMGNVKAGSTKPKTEKEKALAGLNLSLKLDL